MREKVSFLAAPDNTVVRVRKIGNKILEKTPMTTPKRFDRDDVVLAEPVPRIPRPGELYCLVDSRPVRCRYKVFVCADQPQQPRPVDGSTERWILRALDAPPDKILAAAEYLLLREAIERGDAAAALRLLDA